MLVCVSPPPRRFHQLLLPHTPIWRHCRVDNLPSHNTHTHIHNTHAHAQAYTHKRTHTHTHTHTHTSPKHAGWSWRAVPTWAGLSFSPPRLRKLMVTLTCSTRSLLSVRPTVCLSASLPACLPVCLSARLSVLASACMCVRLSVCPSVFRAVLEVLEVWRKKSMQRNRAGPRVK